VSILGSCSYADGRSNGAVGTTSVDGNDDVRSFELKEKLENNPCSTSGRGLGSRSIIPTPLASP